MATLKLKKKTAAPSGAPRSERPPVRGAGSAPRKRPTLSEAQAQRAEREARYQEQLRQRFGDRPPPAFTRRDEPPADPRRRPDDPRRRPDDVRQRPADPRRRPDDTRQRMDDPRRRPDDPRRRPPDAPPMPPARRGGPRDEPNQAFETRRPPQRNPSSGRGTVHAPNQAFESRRAPPKPAAPRPTPDTRRPRPLQPERHEPAQGNAGPLPSFLDPLGGPDAKRQVWGRSEHAEIPGSMRLSKRMSELGIASRREADEWIAKGWVRVDGQVVSELGSRVLPEQHITVDAKAKFQQAQKVTVLLNKPVGYVSGQAEDGYEPAVVLVTADNQWREDRSGTRYLREHQRGLAPAGRLDLDSVGLLVLTQDGRVAKQLIGEDSEIETEYLVRVETEDGARLPADKLALLQHGLELDGEPLRPAQVEWVNEDQLRFVLKEGKKRQIRRMCEVVGLKVLGLKRVRIGNVMLGDLPPGQWRYLRADERFA
ncbi:Dual-specificity RNA pseudouridine synthase RluF [Burkholderiaceae bacterium]|nr:Dual-specificity RNA pseudouridine synthase RluF [Burkholderiaceae bacterium]